MNNEVEYPNGCSEEFAELCALSTSGELSAEERSILREHVADCAPCAALLREYKGLATIGMAKLAAEWEPEVEAPFSYSEKRAEERFVAAFHAQPSWRSKLQSHLKWPLGSGDRSREGQVAFFLATAAVLAICVAGAFEAGRKIETGSHRSVPTATAVPMLPVPDRENLRLKAELVAAQTSLTTVTAKTVDLERQLEDLSNTRASLLTQIEDLTAKTGADSALLASATQQRDGLQQQLNDTSSALVRTREDLNRSQQDRQGTLFRVASLETEVRDLHAELSATSNSAGNDEKFLAADRDIRELMGARQLYISDVFDVQNNGERSKPFGRVFYTKGKSLIFYAFDLQAQPGYREAKAFQAWGKPDSASGKPISLGIFYVDDEQNRRWMVKADNPSILSQINAVFVTVEPRGGSQKPTGKPFLEAYLHSLPPNHP